jgi:hypothetical protein
MSSLIVFLLILVDFLEESELGLVPEGQPVEAHAKQGHSEGPDIYCLPTEGVHVRVATLWGHELVGTFSLL